MQCIKIRPQLSCDQKLSQHICLNLSHLVRYVSTGWSQDDSRVGVSVHLLRLGVAMSAQCQGKDCFDMSTLKWFGYVWLCLATFVQ